MFGLSPRPWDISRNISCLCLTASRKTNIFHAWVKTPHAWTCDIRNISIDQKWENASVAPTGWFLIWLFAWTFLPCSCSVCWTFGFWENWKCESRGIFQTPLLPGCCTCQSPPLRSCKKRSVSVPFVGTQFRVYRINIILVLADNVTLFVIFF